MEESMNNMNLTNESNNMNDIMQPGFEAGQVPVINITVPISNMNLKNDKLEYVLNNFPIFGLSSILYSILFTFCLYRNYAGITLPLFALGTIAYYVMCMKKLSVTIKKASYFYLGAAFLLSVITVFTDNSFFIFYNYVGMLLLLVICLIHNFYDDEHFKLNHYCYLISGTIFGILGYLTCPIHSFNLYINEKSQRDSKIKYVIYGLFISIPLLFIIINLLMSADAVFYDVFDTILSEIIKAENFFGISFMFLLGFIGSYCMIANLASGQNQPDISDKRTKEPVIAITFTTMLTLVYLLFCSIQIQYLFLGNSLPVGYTYAEYAREGFFQLLFVCVINLAIVFICISGFRQHRALNVILSVFSVCTFIMIASSAMRMILYIKAYYLSLDRVLVLWALTVITLLMICLLTNIYKEDFPLFRYGVIIVAVGYILLSASRPDTYIARYNIEKNSTTNGVSTLDFEYLLSLSNDAVPVIEQAGLLRFIEENAYYDIKDEELADYYTDILEEQKDMGIRNFNFSRSKAYNIVKQYYGNN